MRQRVNSSACAATVAAISDYGLFSPRVLIQRAMETAIFVGVGRSVSMSVGKSSAPRVRGLVQRADGGELARITVYLDPDVAMKLKRHCFENGLQVSDLAAQAVSKYVAKL